MIPYQKCNCIPLPKHWHTAIIGFELLCKYLTTVGWIRTHGVMSSLIVWNEQCNNYAASVSPGWRTYCNHYWLLQTNTAVHSNIFTKNGHKCYGNWTRWPKRLTGMECIQFQGIDSNIADVYPFKHVQVNRNELFFCTRTRFVSILKLIISLKTLFDLMNFLYWWILPNTESSWRPFGNIVLLRVSNKPIFAMCWYP